MTWQRIDENTYIDDSLVTCAEYQLFIDEMREQGKYYQPNHWASVRFPKEQALLPVLGVRPFHVETFCEWLNYQEEKIWKFRLATLSEADQYKPDYSNQSGIGYWTRNKEKIEFSWLGNFPANARNIFETTYLYHNLASDNPYETAIQSEFNNHLMAALDDLRNIPLDNPVSLRKTYEDAEVLAKSYSKEENTYIRKDTIAELPHILSTAIEIKFTNSRKPFIDPDFMFPSLKKTSTENEVMFENYRKPYCYSRELESLKVLLRSFAVDLMHDLVVGFHREIILANVHSICIAVVDIHTLNERIAGRSPAFEGIRLVKERIR